MSGPRPTLEMQIATGYCNGDHEWRITLSIGLHRESSTATRAASYEVDPVRCPTCGKLWTRITRMLKK